MNGSRQKSSIDFTSGIPPAAFSKKSRYAGVLATISWYNSTGDTTISFRFSSCHVHRANATQFLCPPPSNQRFILILIVILILIASLPRPPRPRGVGESGPPSRAQKKSGTSTPWKTFSTLWNFRIFPAPARAAAKFAHPLFALFASLARNWLLLSDLRSFDRMTGFTGWTGFRSIRAIRAIRS
jgi:hypothetical protein